LNEFRHSVFRLRISLQTITPTNASRQQKSIERWNEFNRFVFETANRCPNDFPFRREQPAVVSGRCLLLKSHHDIKQPTFLAATADRDQPVTRHEY
ncbi:MAG: hypothetical protein WC429_21885, partial [Verrucomicrobiia bacterium]